MAEYMCSPLRDGHIGWYIRGMVETTSMFVCTAEDQLIGRMICRLRERRLLVLLLSVQAYSNGIVAAGKGGSKMLLRIQVDPLRKARGCSPVESWSE